MKLREFGKFQKLNLNSTKEFRKFLNESWRKRYKFYDDRELYSDEISNSEQRFLTFDGDYVKARNYVGYITYEGESITIYPKIFNKDVKEEDIDNYLMLNLIYWLKRCTKIKFPIVDTNIEFNKEDSILEILIYIFSKITLDVVYNNPYNCYEEVEEELPYLKGRLNIPEYLKNNISTGRWNSFSTIYEPFVYNNEVNKIIKFVSKKLINVTRNQESSENLKKIIFILDEVDDVALGENACDGISITRFNKEYETVIAFCEMFLRNSSITSTKDNEKLNFCFLVPMELIYEDFIYNFIKENFKDKFKEITKQKSNLYLADLYLDGKYSGKAFNLKQDIYLKDNEDNVYILDTKYKLLNKNKEEKYGISQGDLYQMSSYALRGGYNKLALAYPKIFEFDREIKYVVNSGFSIVSIEIEILSFNFMLDYNEYCRSRDFTLLGKNNDEKLKLETISYLLNTKK
ncbi:McrC family protein [Clostridium sp. CTA-7]